MENKPLVSIITITYNRSELIHRCIESIQRQTYKNYEHIIVDGNSHDNTEEVIRSYNDPHIKYIKLNTRGPQIQMRAGADVATGKYVTFLDDDDEYLPTKVEKQVELFEALPPDYGIVYCWMTYFDNAKPDVPIKMHKTELRGDVGDIAVSAELVCGTPTLLIRRDVFEEFGGTFDDSHGLIMSDWELATRICQKYKVDYVLESLVKVYVNHGQARLSTDFYADKAKRGILFYTHLLDEFKDVFERHPEYAKTHYYHLTRYNSMLNHRKEAFRHYCKYLKTSPTVKDSLKLLAGVILGR